METLIPISPSFGPSLHGAELHINDAIRGDFHNGKYTPISVDVETDEQDNFVSVALCWDEKDVWFFNELTDNVKLILSEQPLIGHNVKFDLKLLKKWGVSLNSSSLYFDTCLASYVMNTTKESHHLKDLCKEQLGLVWPSYKEMVGSGKKKVTLDKQEVGRVAAYNGMDAFATFKLYQLQLKRMTPQQKHILDTLELPTARILMDMEMQGALVDVPYLQKLDEQFKMEMTGIEAEVHHTWLKNFPKQHNENCAYKKGVCVYHPLPKDVDFNINSNAQIASLLERLGAVLPTTPKGNKKVDKATLEQWTSIPVVPLLQRYSLIEKLWSTYTQGLLSRQVNGRIHTSFNQITRNDEGAEVGISTTRLSSSNPNLQNIPIRSEDGALIRKAFIAPDSKMLIDADYSQIEYRLLAHFSGEPVLIKAFHEGKDVHEETGKMFGVDRNIGKTLNFASIYGAQEGKIARTAGISEERAKELLTAYWKALPRVSAWVNRVKFAARQQKGVFTYNRRWIPLPGIASGNRFERMHWERAAVNYVVQGSAAEIMKLALIALRKSGFLPALTVHDEFVIERDSHGADYDGEAVKKIMESVVNLDVPLVADVGYGIDWQSAKGD